MTIPRTTIDKLKIAARNSHQVREDASVIVLTYAEIKALQELLDQCGKTVVSPPIDAVQILMHDRDEWKARALKAERELVIANKDASDAYARGQQDESDRTQDLRDAVRALKTVLDELDY